MIRAKFSNSYRAKKERIRKIPTFMGDSMSGILKRDANKLIKMFHDGIKYDTLELEFLKDETVLRKESKGYEYPESPLYGAGDDAEPNSYSNMLRIRKIKNGWKIYPSKAKHHESGIPLDSMFRIHEFGAKVVTKSGTVIQIPPRPAFLLTYRAFMAQKKRDKRETSREVKQAITDLINSAQSSYLDESAGMKDNKDHIE